MEIEVPAALVPFLQRLTADPNDYEANKAVASFLVSNPDTRLQSLEFFSRALAHRQTDDPDHQPMLERYSDILIYKGDFESAFEPLSNLVSTHPAHNPQYDVYLAVSCFRTGRVEMASDAARKIVGHLYDSAREHAEQSDEPVTQLLTPDNILRSHFGELAIKLDLYAKAKILGLTPDVRALLPVLRDEVVNGCLYDCLKSCLSNEISFPSSVEERDAWVRKHPTHLLLDHYVDGNGRGLDMNRYMVVVQRQWEESGRGPLVTLPDTYDEKGWALLRERGLPDDGWFACFHARGGGYRSDFTAGNLTHYRNSDIGAYIPAMEAVRERGGWVVRLGDPSMPPLPRMEGVIDYATSDWRDDWIDVFLLARSRFFVGVPSGPIAVAQAFGVPIVGVNWFPFEEWLANSNVISIFKRYRQIDTGDYMTVDRMASPEIRRLFSKSAFDAKGIEVVDNTSEEICATVVEMLDSCDGLIEYSAEDDDLQQQFEDHTDLFDVGVNGRIGRDFLSRHRSLLG